MHLRPSARTNTMPDSRSDTVDLSMFGEHPHHVQAQRLAEREEDSRDRDVAGVGVLVGAGRYRPAPIVRE